MAHDRDHAPGRSASGPALPTAAEARTRAAVAARDLAAEDDGMGRLALPVGLDADVPARGDWDAAGDLDAVLDALGCRLDAEVIAAGGAGAQDAHPAGESGYTLRGEALAVVYARLAELIEARDALRPRAGGGDVGSGRRE